MSGFRKKYTVNRKASGYMDDTGTWVEGTSLAIEIKASVQPLNADETETLAEGERTSETVKLYTKTRLQTAKQAYGDKDAVEPDVLIYDDRTWKIIRCSGYQCGVINHYKCYAQEVSDGN